MAAYVPARLTGSIHCHCADSFLGVPSSFHMFALACPFFLHVLRVFPLHSLLFSHWSCHKTSVPNRHAFAGDCRLLELDNASWQLQPHFPVCFAFIQSVVIMASSATLQASVIAYPMHL